MSDAPQTPETIQQIARKAAQPRDTSSVEPGREWWQVADAVAVAVLKAVQGDICTCCDSNQRLLNNALAQFDADAQTPGQDPK